MFPSTMETAVSFVQTLIPHSLSKLDSTAILGRNHFAACSAYHLTLAGTVAFKMIENHEGVASVSVAQQVVVQNPTRCPAESLPTA